MPMLDVFDGDAFSLQSMTARINNEPETPTLLGDLGIFEEDGVDTTAVTVEKRNEGLTLVGSSPRGGPGESVGGESRTLRMIKVPHFQRDDAVLADEVQNVRAFGTDSVLETLMDRIDRKAARHARSLDFTLENLRMGAVNGLVLDKDGTTLLDLAAVFDVSIPSAVDFALNTDATDVRGKCATVLDGIGDALEGQQLYRVYGLCGDTFHANFVAHSKVVDTYKYWQGAVNLRSDPRLPFEFGGISWIRYHTKAKAKAAKGNASMVTAKGCRFVVSGVPELYITRFAPADLEETVNTVGLPRYSRQYPMANGKGRHLEVQMNAICMCTQPEALFSATTP